MTSVVTYTDEQREALQRVAHNDDMELQSVARVLLRIEDGQDNLSNTSSSSVPSSSAFESATN
jgi:hypothetical protein